MKERLGECKIYASQFTCIRWELWASFQRPHHGSPQSSLRAMHKVCCFILLIIKPLDFNELKKRYVWYQISCHTLKGLCLADRNSASRWMACPQYGWTFQTSLYYFLSISLFFFFFGKSWHIILKDCFLIWLKIILKSSIQKQKNLQEWCNNLWQV